VTRGERFAEARALFEHFVRALERARKRSPDARAAAALLDRGSQSPAAWLLQLDELRQGGAVRYRVAALDPELLADIVSDGSAAASRRAGAAAALARLDDGGRQTVRVAADACAEPKLRAVLLALSEAQSDDAFVDALSRVGASKAP
jgi:hypothetical protein